MTTPERPEKRCRRAAPPPPPDIPDDLLLSDVLPRLPVKSLARFKCVCRSWRAAVERDPALVRRHLALSRAAVPPSMLVVPCKEFYCDDVPKEMSFHRLILGNNTAPGAAAELVFRNAWPDGVRQDGAVPTHCDGLVAIAASGDRVLVCNPATRELVVLPPASRDALDDCSPPPVALGYDPRRNRYVVARCFYRKCYVHEDVASGEVWLVHYDIGHETFTLGGGVSSGWELTADPPHAVARETRPVCTAEAFYWCTAAAGVVRQPSNKLLRFGLRDRAFEVLPFPPGADFVGGADHLTELAGMPCYVRPATDTAFEFWVANEDGKWEWSLRCRVDFVDYGESVGVEAMVVVAAAGDEMVVAADHRELYVYDVRRGSVRRVVDMEEELEYEGPDWSTCEYRGDLLLHHVVPYVESLVSIGRCNYTRTKTTNK
ncbi:unnamed protein product [Urochloa decumbens]|uniref:F-box domain-containing protein n=1 Tax=Urochloa decumbens TaxID=240449 RepID=A0ABC9D727_9POAL